MGIEGVSADGGSTPKEKKEEKKREKEIGFSVSDLSNLRHILNFLNSFLNSC